MAGTVPLREQLQRLPPEALLPMLQRYNLVVTAEASMDDIVGALASEMEANGHTLEGHGGQQSPAPPHAHRPSTHSDPGQPHHQGASRRSFQGPSPGPQVSPGVRRPSSMQQMQRPVAMHRPSSFQQMPEYGARPSMLPMQGQQQQQQQHPQQQHPQQQHPQQQRRPTHRPSQGHHAGQLSGGSVPGSPAAPPQPPPTPQPQGQQPAPAVDLSKFSTEQLMDHARELGFVPDTTWTRDFAIGTLTQHYMRAQNETAAAGQQGVELSALASAQANEYDYEDEFGLLYFLDPHSRQYLPYPDDQQPPAALQRARASHPRAPPPRASLAAAPGRAPHHAAASPGYPDGPGSPLVSPHVHGGHGPHGPHGGHGLMNTRPSSASMQGHEAYPRREYDASFFFRNDSPNAPGMNDRFLLRGEAPGWGAPGVAPGNPYGGYPNAMGYPGSPAPYPGYPPELAYAMDPGMAAAAQLEAGTTTVVDNPMVPIQEGEQTTSDAPPPPPSDDASVATSGSQRSQKRLQAMKSALGQTSRVWVPPSKDKARLYASLNMPSIREPGQKQGRPYPVCSTKMSRHCWSAFPDFCCEGKESRMLRYGAGISSWFKFLKWLAWTFSIMSVLALPELVLNTFGASDVNVVDIGLAATTIGNLGDHINSTRIFIPSTTCGEEECSISKSEAAEIYATLDMVYSIIFLAAFLWLMFFERREGRIAKRKIITVDDYSVVVEWVPPDTTAEDVRRHFEFITLGHKVKRVDIAENNSWLIRMYIQRGKLLKRIADAYDRVLMLEANGKASKRAKKLRDKLLKKQVHLDALRQAKQERKGDGIALKAYVTFASEEGRVTTLQVYPRGFTAWLCQPRHNRFGKFDASGKEREGKLHRIEVNPAPKPSTVLWENLTYGYTNRMLRRVASTAVALFCILMSTALVFWASYRQAQAKAAGGELICVPGAEYTVNATAAETNPGHLHCYCKHLGATALSDPLCHQWSLDQSFALILSYAASITLVVVNGLLNIVMKKLSWFERHHSIDEREISFSSRLSLCLFINTCVIVVLVNARLRGLDDVQGATYQDFVSDWYAAVGSSLMLTMMLNAVSIHFAPVFRYFSTGWRLRCCKPHSQRQLNEWILGPEFHISIRYAQTMNTVFTCLAFASGMPLMLPIAAFSFILAYWVDKWLFLRFYRIPPQYGVELGTTHTSRIPYAMLLHLAIGVWMFGNANIFESTSLRLAEVDATASFSDTYVGLDWGDRVSQRHVLPLFLFLVFVLAVLLLTSLCTCARKTCLRLVSCITCGNVGSEHDGDEFRENYKLPTYDQAVEDHLMQGIPTYNILQNPLYARSFAISAAFAAEHSRVASVKNFKAVKKTRSQRSREKHRQERRAKKHGSRAERTARRTSQMMLEAEAKQFRSQRR